MLLCCVAAAVSCVGTTGSSLVTFRAFGSGPPDAVAGKPYPFDSGRGFHVTLTKTVLHIGALYLNRSVPTSGAQATSCTLPGIYVGEVTDGLDLDVLSPLPQEFPSLGSGTADRAAAGEVWLTGGDVTAAEDSTVILELAGVATKGTETFPFEGTVTIGTNRAVPATDSTAPGAHPICKQRIVSPIVVPGFTMREGGALHVMVDPRGWFANVDFSQLTQVSSTPPLYRFLDSGDDAPSRSLYVGLHANDGVYHFTFGP